MEDINLDVRTEVEEDGEGELTARNMSGLGHESLAWREQHQELKDKVKQIHEEVQNVVRLQKEILEKVERAGPGGNGFGNPKSLDLICRVCNLRKDVVELPLPLLPELLMDANAVVPMMQMISILTCTSFALQVRNARVMVSDNIVNNFSDKLDVIRGASGFSLLFFAVKNNAKQMKYATGVGRLTSLFVRETLVPAILYVKENECQTTTPGAAARSTPRSEVRGSSSRRRSQPVPAWMQAMTSAESVRKSVATVCRRLEMVDLGTSSSSAVTPGRAAAAISMTSTHSSGEEGPVPKRARVEKSPEDLEERYRQEAIAKIRTIWVQFLNKGRTEIRSYLHLNLMFLREIIEEKFELNPAGTRSGIEMAREAGYEYVFQDESADEELTVPEEPKGTRWDIPVAKFVDPVQARAILSHKAMGFPENCKYIDVLRDNFPCLSVKMRYKREVRRDPGDSIGRLAGEARAPLFYQTEETISLHKLAIDALVERFKVRDTCSFLSLSALSFRAVHVFAIAIRALLRHSLGLRLCPAEAAALGNAVHRHILPTADSVITRMEAPKTRAQKKVTVSSNIAAKMTMTIAEYEAATIARSTPAPAQAAETALDSRHGSRSITSEQQGRSSGPSASARDLNAGWMSGL